ncbi:hypothetical protein M231_02988 [Tremella mesenterica]|uniref:Uncharacterized protein n=1 Tax=Tremella mesenterica TaxID=5217 RepID=A0A4Q1BPG6_TREME|nr:hypothetical protein M231_02988 [Tremella mesenterica]
MSSTNRGDYTMLSSGRDEPTNVPTESTTTRTENPSQATQSQTNDMGYQPSRAMNTMEYAEPSRETNTTTTVITVVTMGTVTCSPMVVRNPETGEARYPYGAIFCGPGGCGTRGCE